MLLLRLTIIIAVLYSITLFAQKSKPRTKTADTSTVSIGAFSDDIRAKNEMRIMFYNVENLFDTIDNPEKNDEDFLPEGNNRWNSWRYHQKLKNIYKVITAVGGWEPPDVIGFCEIENRFVLEELLKKTPLRNYGYQIAHHESPDRRGIDVGLIYRPDKFKWLHDEPMKVSFDNDESFRTRDILYVKALVFNKDTLHLFVNHWPSRLGGALESEAKRIQAASVARKKIDSILLLNPQANILLMGDFNDYPDNKSLYENLRAKKRTDPIKQGDLVNLMFEIHEKHDGSHKYQNHWGALDQIIVSANMLQEEFPLQVKNRTATVFKADFLLKDDERWMGKEPFRTFEGFRYTGGFSDHLPVFTDLIFLQEKN
jgi:predicted extracellular nuclease